MEFNYYYGTQADQYTFLRIPKNIITDKTFVGLSLPAKLLYGLLLDRMSLSMRNKWLDDENRVYIIYQIKEIMNDLSLSEKMAIKHLKELEEFGLVEKRRRGFGLPSILYVKNFIVPDESEKEHTKSDENDIDQGESAPENTSQSQEINRTVDLGSSRTVDSGRSRTVEMESSRTVDLRRSRTVETGSSRTVDLGRSRTAQKEVQEPPDRGALKNKTNMSNNYINNTKINKTKYNNNQSNHILSDQGEKCAQTKESSSNNKPMDGIRFEYDKKTQVRGYEKVIKMKIDYDYLIDRHPHEKERIDGMIEIMVETLVSDSDYINIGGTEYPKELVKSKLLKLDSSHIEYVMMCMDNNTTKIHNIRKYLLAALFNAPSTIDSYYMSLVNHDMYGYHDEEEESAPKKTTVRIVDI